MYWFSRAGPAASVRIYYELTLSGEAINFPKTTVPVGLSFFPKEPAQFPKVCVPIHSSRYSRLMMGGERGGSLLRSKARIVFESEHKVGGHFAAYEQPEALVGDLRNMFGKSGPAAGVVPGCSGY